MDWQAVPQLFYHALGYVMNAEITPMLALWSEQDDVTYIDPQGLHHSGHAALVSYWQRAVQANSQAPGSISVRADLIMAQRSASMICTVMLEHIQIQQDEGVQHMQAASTNVYRYEGQQWCMIHRHSGSLSEDKD